MPQAVMSVTEMNEAVMAAFTRCTGSRDHFHFPRWWAEREREIVRRQADESAELATARWARLDRAEQQRRLLAYLAELPSLVEVMQMVAAP